MQQEKLIFLGTGHAMTLDCFNTCFVWQNEEGENILVDTGGGLQILKQLRSAGIDFAKLHHVILSHKHSDHILGLFWIVRNCHKCITAGKYEGNLNIYLHKELEEVVRTILPAVLPKKFTDLFDERILFHVVEDKEERQILNYSVKFLDIHAKKDRQFGFAVTLANGKRMVFLGDETFDEALREEVEGCDILMHEAFCLESEADIFKPYEKKHSTAQNAALIAGGLKVKNLILYHSSDNDMEHRQAAYTKEAKLVFSGNVYAPVDLDVIEL
ncbi:MAG: MBL fold metallo-hydrolase [Lachnospiraceae bacterium]|nr:MBL fold metallo-hydrolase [Lachnospiraceae bacterium]